MNSLLTPQDLSELQQSGLSLEQIKKLGHFSLQDAKQAFKTTGIKHIGLCFRYIDPLSGENYLTSKGRPFYRIKPRDWEMHALEEAPKYLSPAGEGNRPYWSPLISDFKKKAAKISIPLEIVEGEKKADSLAAEGLFVLGLAGVWSWLDKSTRGEEIKQPPAQLIEDDKQDQEQLENSLEQSRLIPELLKDFEWKNRRVNIAFDSDIIDKPGVRKAAAELATALRSLGAHCYLIRLPNELNGSKNGADDLKVRHGIETYRHLCKIAQPFRENRITAEPNAFQKIFMAWSILKDTWRYRPGQGWLNWEGKFWQLKSDCEFEKDLVFFQDQQGWQGVKGMDVLVRQLRSRLLVPEKSWNNPDYLCFDNGTLNLKTGEFTPEHQKEIFNTSILPYDYIPEADCPTWLEFLSQALGGDLAAVDLIQAFFKWILIPKAKDRKAEIEKSLDLIGAKGTGKGTFLDVLANLVGPGNHGAIGSETFKNPTYLAALLDKKVSIDYDAFGYLADVGLFNKVVSNEPVSTKILYKNPIETRLGTVIVRAYNRVLEVPDGAEGLDRRIIAISFNHQPKEIDLNLSEKLKAELPGIFSWAWRLSMQEVKARLTGAGAVRSVVEASIKRFEANNPEYSFLLELFPEGGRVKAGELYSGYSDWCKENGISAKKKRKFTEAITSLGCESKQSTGGYYFCSIPEMRHFDVITHLGIKKTEAAFQKSFEPKESTYSTNGATTRITAPKETQLSSSSTPEEGHLSRETHLDFEPQLETEVSLESQLSSESQLQKNSKSPALKPCPEGDTGDEVTKLTISPQNFFETQKDFLIGKKCRYIGKAPDKQKYKIAQIIPQQITGKGAEPEFDFLLCQLPGGKEEVFVRNTLEVVEMAEQDKPESGLSISFGKTYPQLLAGKSVTRRLWKPSHAEKFIKAYREGLKIQAFDKDRRYGGKQVGWVVLTAEPYQERLIDMPEADVALEGFPELSKEKFIDQFFESDQDFSWVIRFKFEPLAVTSGQENPLKVGNYVRHLDRKKYKDAIFEVKSIGEKIECLAPNGKLIQAELEQLIKINSLKGKNEFNQQREDLRCMRQ